MTLPAPSPSLLLATLARFRRDVDKRDKAAIKQLSGAYRKVFQRLQEKAELEARRIFENGGDTVSRDYIARRLAALTDAVQAELEKYSRFLETTIDATADDAL